MDRFNQFVTIKREIREGKRTISDGLRSAALVGGATERGLALALVRRSLPAEQAESLCAVLTRYGVLENLGLEAKKETRPK